VSVLRGTQYVPLKCETYVTWPVIKHMKNFSSFKCQLIVFSCFKVIQSSNLKHTPYSFHTRCVEWKGGVDSCPLVRVDEVDQVNHNEPLLRAKMWNDTVPDDVMLKTQEILGSIFHLHSQLTSHTLVQCQINHYHKSSPFAFWVKSPILALTVKCKLSWIVVTERQLKWLRNRLCDWTRM